VASGTDIRLIDTHRVHKSQEGNCTAVQLRDLSVDERMNPL
jgi:hypothetical protein